MSACFVVHASWLYSVLDTVLISGEDVCCSVAFDTLVGVSVFSGFLMISAMIFLCDHQCMSAIV